MNLVTIALTILILLISGCETPGSLTLRIGITESAGASCLYLAEELCLYEMNGADVRMAELENIEACEHAFQARTIDAVVLPYSHCLKMIRQPYSDAGVLLVLAIPKLCDSTSHWQTGEPELLLVRRSEVMRRRSEWSDLLAAYERARLGLDSQPDSMRLVLAQREHRDSSEIEKDMSLWSFFSIEQQDSLLDTSGALSDLDARWQGNLEFSAKSARHRNNRHDSAQQPDQIHSR